MESRCGVNLKGERDHPSFSSTLLDAIYRSFDESGPDIRPSSRSRSQSLLRGDGGDVFFEEMVFKKQIGSRNGGMMKSSSVTLDRSRGGAAEERKSRGRIVEDDHVIRRRSLPPEAAAEFAVLRSSAVSSERRRSIGSFKLNSSVASSSGSSSAGRMSSADADFFYGKKNKNALKPIRTSFSDPRSETFPETPLPPKSDSGGKSAKSRALKLYGDLKRMKQPISPGGKLANFLNSLFSATGGSKKQRISSSPSSARAAAKWESKSNFTTNTSSSCSTASSYSRSCLSKRPSSSGRYDCGVKRSVRFCPVAVIVDEDLKPCGTLETIGSAVDNKRVEAMARDLLRNYHQRNNGGAEKMETSTEQNMSVDANEEEDDDADSCCSSDLFELEIGVDRYCEELPVYETTRVETNRAIATGRIA